MTWRTAFAAIALMAAPSAKALCMGDTTPAPSVCTVEGTKHFLVKGADEASICARFKQELSAAMGDDAAPDAHRIAITIAKDGTITARIAANTNNSESTSFELSVNVMDRNLDYRDLTRLAKASAQHIMQESTGS